ncbi:MAG: hypothetical protein Q9195_007286 [Heterodermia aff. obscurata]
MAGIDKDTSTSYVDERSQDSSVGRHPVNALETNPWWKFGGRDRSYIPTRNEPSKSSLDSLTDPRDIENENNADLSVFNDTKAYDIYKPIEKYEGRHRFDPRATWSAGEEKKLVRKVILYLSYFYKNAELPIRLACFWTSYVGTNIAGSFLAYGILHLRGHNGWEGWRYLFAIEGGITAAIGIISWLYLPPSPTQTKRHGLKGLLRPKAGWFSEREEIVMVTRILRDDPGKSTMHNRQAISPRLLWASLADYDMWPIYLIGLTWTVPFTPETSYLSLTLRSLGFDVFQTNLLIIPSSVLFILQLLFWTWFSEKFNQRFLIGLISQIWVFPLLIALETLPLKFHGAQWARFALSSLIVGYPGNYQQELGQRENSNGRIIYLQHGGPDKQHYFLTDDKPLYRRGNKVLLGLAAWNSLLFISAKFYYVWKNR